MNHMTSVVTCVTLGLILFFASGCADEIAGPAEIVHLQVNNDEAYLNERMAQGDGRVIPLRLTEELKQLSGLQLSSVAIELKLRAEVEPPSINSHLLHASHVTFDNRRAYVSYSTVFSDYRGGVEIFDMTNITQPRIVSQALMPDTDVTIALKTDGKLFLGVAADPGSNPDLKSPAALEVIDLKNGALTNVSQRFDLPSFNANDVNCFDNTIFVTSGTTGGALTMFNNHSLEFAHQIQMDSVKAVVKSTDYVVLLEGTGRRLHLLNRQTWALEKTVEIGCSNFFQAKAEMDVFQNKVYLSALGCGLMVVDLHSGNVSKGIPAPPGGQTNAISITDDGLVFLANGSDGMQVARISGNSFEILGTALFDGSTNYVAARGDELFIANGSGGLKIVEIVR